MSKRSHSELYYHFVWSTNGWAKLISLQWEGRLHGYIESKCAEYGYLVLGVNGMEDHIHCLIRSEPEILPSEIVGKLKGSSSRFITVQNLSPVGFSWQNGYGVFSVSRWDVDRIMQYIRNQKQHHSQGTAEDDLERADVPENQTRGEPRVCAGDNPAEAG